MLCTKLYTEVPHKCGLHPKAHRIYKGDRKQSQAKYRSPNIIDGDLVAEFPGLDRAAQQQLARRMGSRVDAIHTILKGIQQELAYF